MYTHKHEGRAVYKAKEKGDSRNPPKRIHCCHIMDSNNKSEDLQQKTHVQSDQSKHPLNEPRKLNQIQAPVKIFDQCQAIKIRT